MPDPSILMRFAASEHTTRMTYDAANRLTATNNALSTPTDPRVWTREYDAAGRLIARTDANGTRITQTYNADGQLASIDYPNGKRVTYDWTCCRMASMSDDYGRSRFTYDVANRLVSALDPTGHVFPSSRTPPVHHIPPPLAYSSSKGGLPACLKIDHNPQPTTPPGSPKPPKSPSWHPKTTKPA